MATTVRCPGCGVELEILDTDRVVLCGECRCRIELVWYDDQAYEAADFDQSAPLVSEDTASSGSGKRSRAPEYTEYGEGFCDRGSRKADKPKRKVANVLIPLSISAAFLVLVAIVIGVALLIKDPSVLGLGSSPDAAPSPSPAPSQEPYEPFGPAFLDGDAGEQTLNINYEGLWVKDGNNRLSIYSQEERSVSIYISADDGQGRTATADIGSVVLTDSAGNFHYSDDLGNSGTGSLIFLSPQQLLVQFDSVAGQSPAGVAQAGGEYLYSGPVPEDMIPKPTPTPEAAPSTAPTAEPAAPPEAESASVPAPAQGEKPIWEYPFFNIACYPDQDRNITTYYQVGVPFEGKSYIDGSATADADQCTIWEIYSNGWIKISYETYKGLKTAYCYLSDFINLSPSGVRETGTYSDEPVYKKSTLRDVFGVVSAGDSCYVVSENGYASQIIYKLDSGTWKMGWVASDKLK